MGGTTAEHLRDFSGNGRNLTQAGTNAVEAPSWLPWGSPIVFPQTGAAGGYGPTLSLPGVQSVTATGATPKVTLTFA